MSYLHGWLERTPFHRGASRCWCPCKHVVQLIPGNLQTLCLPGALPRPACRSRCRWPAPFPRRTRGTDRFLPTSSPVKTQPSSGNKPLHFPPVKMEWGDLYWQQSCLPSTAVCASEMGRVNYWCAEWQRAWKWEPLVLGCATFLRLDLSSLISPWICSPGHIFNLFGAAFISLSWPFLEVAKYSQWQRKWCLVN